MASYSFQFLAVFIIFLGGIQEALLVPSPVGNNIEHHNQMFDIDVLLNRLDQMEAKNEQQHIKMAELQAKVAKHEVKAAEQELKINSHEMKINSQQEEIDQLKKKNSELIREKDNKLIQAGDDVNSRISHLKTSASSEKAATRKPSSCLDLLDLGHTLTGFYDVLPVGSSQIASIYCDFGLESTEIDFETRVGFVDVKSSPVHFFVTRTSSWNSTGKTIPFEKEYLNLGGGMNLTSGVFTAPRAGIYAFTFKGLGYGTTSGYGYGDLFLHRNDMKVARGKTRIYGATSNTESTLSIHSTLKLNKGDTITILLWAGTIYSDGYGEDIHFTGSLLQEDLMIS